jgi:hypothetical protein
MSGAWFGFGIDVVDSHFFVMTIAETKAGAEESCREQLRTDPMVKDVSVWRVFNLLDSSELPKLHAWLVDCKIPRKEIKNILRQLSDTILRMKPS